jgi:hypothetical protein
MWTMEAVPPFLDISNATEHASNLVGSAFIIDAALLQDLGGTSLV